MKKEDINEGRSYRSMVKLVNHKGQMLSFLFLLVAQFALFIFYIFPSIKSMFLIWLIYIAFAGTGFSNIILNVVFILQSVILLGLFTYLVNSNPGYLIRFNEDDFDVSILK